MLCDDNIAFLVATADADLPRWPSPADDMLNQSSGDAAFAVEVMRCDNLDALVDPDLLPPSPPTEHDPVLTACPCDGCRADREEPDAHLDDPDAWRREVRRRSNVHNLYRDSVGRGSARDPGPRSYRKNRRPRRA